jgi:hypothetical protein
LSMSHAVMLQTQGEMLDLTRNLELLKESANESIRAICEE